MKFNRYFESLTILLILFSGCSTTNDSIGDDPLLQISENGRYLEYADDREPFFWLGGTSWGMSEWLTREEIVLYLDNRKQKHFNVVQVCLFWGKRQEDPVRFTLNPENAYGFRAFSEADGVPDGLNPQVIKGGTPENPNDYWDHVEFILDEASKREMIVALLPVWGRRYVNATHGEFSHPVFTPESMRSYGSFLGSRFHRFKNIIWVLGGDVPANMGGDFLGHYRAMAEGLLLGITDEKVKWNEPSQFWDRVLITYHPDGNPFRNSSEWFHEDPWLDFNMIETYKFRNSVYSAVSMDYLRKSPIKPVVMGEPSYEGYGPDDVITKGIHIRRQAFQSFFAGAAGFTYGGKIDEKGRGPLWSPTNDWEALLDLEGASTMKYVREFCLDHGWPDWIPDHSILPEGIGKGEFQKVAVRSNSSNQCYIYFPDCTSLTLDFSDWIDKAEALKLQWFDPSSGTYMDGGIISIELGVADLNPPQSLADAVLIVSLF